MADTLWLEVKAIVADALEQPEAARGRFVAARCAGRAALQQEVESLLIAHARAGPFMDEPFDPSGLLPDTEADDGDAPACGPGAELGAYRLLRELGRGGMGTVYLAERADRAFDKHVAIKVVAGRVASPDLIRRFLDERRILAILDHENIARVLDAGATEDGVPYVVMEFVDGTTIDAHCQERRLSIRQRLDLFRRVCAAVHHAHQRLIVHRDIKAANILVTAGGQPKLLDFGIAKLLEEGRVRTDTALRAFTPESASPEQMRGEPITVTSDVYSLGGLLYRLLTDRKVFDFTSTSDLDMLRTICDQPPVPPSEAPGAATHGERVDRDLDWITLKALRKEPDRRYASAAQLNEDCERYLTGQTVLAGPDTFRYRSSKFLRRHWAAAGAVAAIIAILTVTSTAVWYQRQRAERRFNDVRKLANTLVGELYDAIAEVPGSTVARQLLVARALGHLDALSREAGRDTALKIDLADAYQKIGDVQGNPYGANLGDAAGARSSYTTLLSLRTAIHAARGDRQAALNLGRAHSRLGDMDLGQGQYGEAVEAYHRAIALFDGGNASSVAADDALEDRARTQSRLGVALTWAGRRDEAKTAILEAIRLTGRIPDRPDTSRLKRRSLAVNYGTLGDLHFYSGNFEEALESHRQGTGLARALLAETPDDATPKRTLMLLLARVAGDLLELNRHEQSIQATGETIAIEEALIKADPMNVQLQFDLADLYGNLATSQRETKQLDAALRSIEYSLQLSRRAAEKNPNFTAHRFNFAGALRQLGLVQRDRGAAQEAIRAFRESIAVYDSVPSDQRDPSQPIAALADLGHALAGEAKRLDSAPIWRDARLTLLLALERSRTFQPGSGGNAAHRQAMDAVASALAEVDRHLAKAR